MSDATNSTPQNLIPSIPTSLCTDHLSLSLTVQWDSARWPDIYDFLLLRWRAATEGNPQDRLLRLGDTVFWVIRRWPTKYRYNEHRPRFILQSQGILIGLPGSNKRNPAYPNVSVYLGPESLIPQPDLAVQWQRIQTYMKLLGATILDHSLNSIATRIDLAGVLASDLVALEQQGHLVTRAKRSDFHKEGECLTGMTIGREPRIRVYDKLRELRNHPETTRLLTAQWAGTLPEQMTRIEFELGAKALQSNGIATIEDWMLSGKAALTDLSESTRFHLEPVNRKHPKRGPLLPAWQAVQNAISSWQVPEAVDMASLPPVPRDPEGALTQLLGTLVWAIAEDDCAVESVQDVVSWISTAFTHRLQEYNIVEKVKQRRAKRGHSHGL